MAPRRKTLDNDGVAALPAKRKRYAHPDPELFGHYIRVQPNGKKSYVAVARNPYDKQVWATIGPTSQVTIEEARVEAKKAMANIGKGASKAREAIPPAPVKPASFAAVGADFIKRYVDKEGLRSKGEIERILNKYVLPVWGEREFIGIRRSDVASLLDQAQDNHGDRQADLVLSVVSKICNWFASRNDDYQTPIVRGMRRWNATANARARVFDDDELRVFWRAAGEAGVSGDLFKVLLLLPMRREKIVEMQWDHIKDGAWHVEHNAREKLVPGVLPLPQAALDIIERKPRMESNSYVFAGKGKVHRNRWSDDKEMMVEKIRVVAKQMGLPAIEDWRPHDCRRTGRTRLSKLVGRDIAERVLGHKIKGVEGVYDRHDYTEEKGHALRMLADHIAEIVNPPRGSKLVKLSEKKARRKKAA